MADIDFHNIAARNGSQRDSFEELCCQLARRTCSENAHFERFRGAGGDGGVECIIRHLDGSIIGWQAKFVFDIDGLINQADKSLKTAITVYKDLAKYIVCFPFDPTGKTARLTKTGRSTKSESEKLDDWVSKATKEAKTNGHDLTIERWPASKIIALLLNYDPSGGIRQYFFSESILSVEWFKNHLVTAKHIAGPRYTQALNIETVLWKRFSAFSENPEWSDTLTSMLSDCQRTVRTLQQRIDAKGNNELEPKWPLAELPTVKKHIKKCEEALVLGQELNANRSESGLDRLLNSLRLLRASFIELENKLAREIDEQHGKGSANSKSFRSFMAEYQVSFPAANLDSVRDVIKEFDKLAKWLHDPAGYLAFKKAFILTGAGGAGKTHGICDMAFRRLENEKYTCIVFGHQFSGLPAEWTRIIESLGLPAILGKDGFLDALNAAGESSGSALIFIIDAVNETRPRDYWIDRFMPLAYEFEKRPFLKLCVSCRTSFMPVCLPQLDRYPVIEHRGFSGIERQACNAFLSFTN